MADKTKTIKSATDKELDELIVRLRKENELQDLVTYLKRKSNPPGNISYDNPNVSTEEPIDTLYHYGILGMKWGKRKSQSGRTTTSSKKAAESQSDDHKKKTNLKKKKVSEMSNAELKDLTTRMQLEKQYKDLRKTEVSAGKKFVNDLIKDVGKELVKEMVKSNAKSGISTLKKALNDGK